MKADWYKGVKRTEQKIEKEKAFRERERQYKAIRTQERAKLLEELEKAVNEKIQYIMISNENISSVLPMVSVEDVCQIFDDAKENSKKIKKFTHI